MPLSPRRLCTAEHGQICVCLFWTPCLCYKGKSFNSSRFPYCTHGGCKPGEHLNDYLLTDCRHSIGYSHKSGGPVFRKTPLNAQGLVLLGSEREIPQTIATIFQD